MFNMFGQTAVNDNAELCIKYESRGVFGIFIMLLKKQNDYVIYHLNHYKTTHIKIMDKRYRTPNNYLISCSLRTTS